MYFLLNFFSNSNELDFSVLKPLSHIHLEWELTWDPLKNKYKEEDNSFSKLLNELIFELDQAALQRNYHDNEDVIAKYVMQNLKWNIRKVKTRWTGAEYVSIMEQGSFSDSNEKNLILSAVGRIHASIVLKQNHFDDMELSHRRILAKIISIILYHRFRANN